MIRRLVTLSFLQTNLDIALLILRVGFGINLFVKHGFEKIVYFNMMASNWMDPLGIGSYATFLIAFLSDAVFSLLIMLGIGTRWCCLYCFCLIFGAWDLRHHFLYFNPPPGSPNHLAGSHGELIVVMELVLLLFIFAGPGRFSLDAWLMRGDKNPANAEAAEGA